MKKNKIKTSGNFFKLVSPSEQLSEGERNEVIAQRGFLERKGFFMG
jgi:hypothetical protein